MPAYRMPAGARDLQLVSSRLSRAARPVGDSAGMGHGRVGLTAPHDPVFFVPALGAVQANTGTELDLLAELLLAGEFVERKLIRHRRNEITRARDCSRPAWCHVGDT
jgi:hypothetical protein